MRFILAVVAVLIAANSSAQDARESVPPTTVTPRTDPSRIVYDLEVSPADEPRPAMKYRLLPNPADLQAGNAATQYYKAFAQAEVSPIHRPAFMKLYEYAEVPLPELDQKDLQDLLATLAGPDFLESIRRATFRSHCDWEEPFAERGIYTRLAFANDTRGIAMLLAVNGKHQLLKGDYESAFHFGRDAFTLGYHMQQSADVAIQNLVGMAVVQIVHDQFLLDWLRAPNSPNLYWALSEIPPYQWNRRLLAGELHLAEYTLPGLKDLEKRVLTEAEANDLAVQAFAVETGKVLSNGVDVKRRIGVAGWVLQAHDEGHRELAASGVSREMLDRMPAAQVALLARWKRFQVMRDERHKWSLLMQGESRDVARKRYDEVARQREVRNSVAPFDEFLPYLGGIHSAQLRQHRYLSALRTIEALRLYAARHGGFPPALTDIGEVPVPNDPVTNTPFVYRAAGKTATLTMARHDLGADMDYEYRLRLREANNAK